MKDIKPVAIFIKNDGMDNNPVKTYCDFITKLDDTNVHNSIMIMNMVFQLKAIMNYLQGWCWR